MYCYYWYIIKAFSVYLQPSQNLKRSWKHCFVLKSPTQFCLASTHQRIRYGSP